MIDLQRGFKMIAEKEGFEPPVQSPGQRFSRPPQSTTLPFLPLHPLVIVGDGRSGCKYNLFLLFCPVIKI